MASYIPMKLRKAINSLSISLGLLVWGLLWSLQPSFYPAKAERVGATSSQYGFVFGICSLGTILATPLFAHYGGKIGPKLLYNVGGFSQGLCAMGFGFLDSVENKWIFLGLSYILRLLEGFAGAAVNTAVVVILMDMYPAKVSIIAGGIEMIYGLGMMLASIINWQDLLLDPFSTHWEGFCFHSSSLALAGICFAAVQALSIPNVEHKCAEKIPNVDQIACEEKEPLLSGDKRLTVWSALKSPMLFLPFFDNFVSFCGVGMIDSMLEPYMLLKANASQGQAATAFFIKGGFYMLATPIAGFVTDKFVHPLIVATVGNLLSALTFLFIGPATFLPMDPSVHLIYVMIGLKTFGSAMAVVTSISRAHKIVIQSGFSKDDADTFLVLSGLWTSSFQLSWVVGPTLSGFMVELWGFRHTTDFFFLLYLLMFLVHLVLAVGYCMKPVAKNK